MNSRILPVFSIFLFLSAGMFSPLEAQWWNPRSWFTSEREEIMSLRPATLEEEAEAEVIYAQGVAAQEAGQKRKALRLFRKIEKDYRRTGPAPDALMRTAEVFISQNKWHDAFQRARITLIRYPDYEGFSEVVELQYFIASSLMQGRRTRIFGFIPSFKATRRARNYFESVVSSAPFSDLAPLALMNIAIISEKRNEPEFAIDALDRLVYIYADSPVAPDAYLRLANVYASLVTGAGYDQASTREAISYYEDFLILFPDSPLVVEAEAGLKDMQEMYAAAKYQLGDFYFRFRRNSTAALTLYNEAITVGPNTVAAEMARTRVEAIRRGERPPRFDMGLDTVMESLRGGRGVPDSAN